MNVWELVTTSSGLPVAPANTFWDHLNDLGAGGGIVIVQAPESYLVEMATLDVAASLSTLDVELEMTVVDVDADFGPIEIESELNNAEFE